jgi:hypothetical protein
VGRLADSGKKVSEAETEKGIRTAMDAFNASERKALQWIMSAHGEEASHIETQLGSAWLISRRNGDQDFLTIFGVVRDPSSRLSGGILVGDAWAHVKGLEYGMTFLLWADEDGFLTSLEGASFGENISGIDFETADIEIYPAPEGDLDTFRPPPPSWRKS